MSSSSFRLYEEELCIEEPEKDQDQEQGLRCCMGRPIWHTRPAQRGRGGREDLVMPAFSQAAGYVGDLGGLEPVHVVLTLIVREEEDEYQAD
eukprot:755749-Hanusia_phi.AAC.9